MEPSIPSVSISNATLVWSLVSAVVGIVVGFVLGLRHNVDDEEN